jgi:hypothetical protein
MSNAIRGRQLLDVLKLRLLRVKTSDAYQAAIQAMESNPATSFTSTTDGQYAANYTKGQAQIEKVNEKRMQFYCKVLTSNVLRARFYKRGRELTCDLWVTCGDAVDIM